MTTPSTSLRMELTACLTCIFRRVSELPRLFDLSKVGTGGVVFDESLLQHIHFKLIRQVCLSVACLSFVLSLSISIDTVYKDISCLFSYRVTRAPSLIEEREPFSTAKWLKRHFLRVAFSR